MITNLAPVSLSNKKVNSYTCLRLTFLKKNATVYAYKSISEPLDFKIFFGGGGGGGGGGVGRRACPQNPVASLPRLFLKSGYGPVHYVVHYIIFLSWDKRTIDLSKYEVVNY